MLSNNDHFSIFIHSYFFYKVIDIDWWMMVILSG